MFLQAVDVPDRCFLQEVLYWVAFQRLPIASYTWDGKEIRETDEIEGFEVPGADTLLSPDETKRAGIPDDPDWAQRFEKRSLFEVSWYDEFLAQTDLDDDLRKRMETDREAARVYRRDSDAWEPLYARAIEYPASKIFVALREGVLSAKGRLLPAMDQDEALAILEAANRDFFDIPITDISPHFWTLDGIHFEASTAKDNTHHYRHISCSTQDMLSVFPGERQDVPGVQRIGDSFILSERHSADRVGIYRGRPSCPWDKFHIEVAGLLRSNGLPEKKEAAIEYLRNWFEREHGIKASRSAIGERLKPYYDRFVRTGGQKIR
jgi:hypothetical protein